MMKILLCLIVLALCVCGAYSRPTTTNTSLPCHLVEDVSESIQNIASLKLKITKLSIPYETSCTSLECVELYYKGVEKLEKNISGLGKLKRFLEKIKMNSTKHEGEFEKADYEPKDFFENMKTFLSNFSRNCK